MRAPETATPAELAFALGKITRHAFDAANADADQQALSLFANSLLEGGDEKVANDLLMVFVAGFEEGDPPERRAHPEDR